MTLHVERPRAAANPAPRTRTDLPPLEAAWTLAPRRSAAAPEPEEWNAGPAAWGARPLDERVDGLSFLLLAVAAAFAVGVVALLAAGVTPALVAALLTLVVGGGIACWLDLRSHGRTPGDLERGVLARSVWGLKGRFTGGVCVDALPAGTRVAIGRNPAGEVCLYAHGREYPLEHGDLQRVRAAMVATSAGGAA